MHDCDAPVFAPLVNVGLSICEGDHPLSVEKSAQGLFEPLRRPASAFPVGLLLHNDPVHQFMDILENGMKFGSFERSPTKEPSEFIAPPTARQPNSNHRGS